MASKSDKCLTSWFLNMSCYKHVVGLLKPSLGGNNFKMM